MLATGQRGPQVPGWEAGRRHLKASCDSAHLCAPPQVGDFVLFGTYIIQLYMPLNWFGTYYR